MHQHLETEKVYPYSFINEMKDKFLKGMTSKLYHEYSKEMTIAMMPDLESANRTGSFFIKWVRGRKKETIV